MPEEEKLKPGEKPVDLDTSGPEVDVTLEAVSYTHLTLPTIYSV